MSGGGGETPRISEHARKRCREMGISTKVAKRIWRERRMERTLRMYDGQSDRVLATSPEYPSLAVVVAPDGAEGREGGVVVVTVVFNVDEDYIREGIGYRLAAAAGEGGE